MCMPCVILFFLHHTSRVARVTETQSAHSTRSYADRKKSNSQSLHVANTFHK
jgi:hypothetical protein